MHNQRVIVWLAVGLGLGLGLGCNKGNPATKATGEPAQAQVKPERDVKFGKLLLPADWNTYASKPCGYTVELPQPPRPATSKPDDELDVLGYEGMDYSLVSRCMSEDRDAEQIAQGLLAQWPGATATVESIELRGSPGRAIDLHVAADNKPPDITRPGELDVRIRFYLVGGRRYQLQTVSPTDSPIGDKAAERFFASFRLLDAPPQPTGSPTQ